MSDPKGKESHTLMLSKFLNVLASNFQTFKLSGISKFSAFKRSRPTLGAILLYSARLTSSEHHWVSRQVYYSSSSSWTD